MPGTGREVPITSGIVVRACQVMDEESIVAIDNESRPEFPPRTVEEMRYYRDTRPPDTYHACNVAERNDRVVGYVKLQQMWWVNEPHRFTLNLIVERSSRRQGIGTVLYHAALEQGQAQGARRIYTEVRGDLLEAMHFAQARGFQPSGRMDRESRLDTRIADLEEQHELEEVLQQQGIRIVTLADLGTDERTVHALHELCDAAAHDVPSSEEFTSTPCELWHDEILRGPGMSPETQWIALDGDQMVGLALLKRKGIDAAYNDFTATHRAYRGRGIARALKGRTVEWARRNGVHWIYTGNDFSNSRMLDINIRLGYQMLPETIELVKDL